MARGSNRLEQEIAMNFGYRKLQVVAALAKCGNVKRSFGAGHRCASCSWLQCENQFARHGLLSIIHHHYVEGPFRARIQLRLPEVDVHSQRPEGLFHVVFEVRLEFERANVVEVIACKDMRAFAIEISKVKNCGMFPERTMVFSQTCQQVCS